MLAVTLSWTLSGMVCAAADRMCSLVKYRDNTEIHMQVCVCKYGRRKVVISFTRADASLFPYYSAQRCKT